MCSVEFARHTTCVWLPIAIRPRTVYPTGVVAREAAVVAAAAVEEVAAAAGTIPAGWRGGRVEEADGGLGGGVYGAADVAPTHHPESHEVDDIGVDSIDEAAPSLDALVPLAWDALFLAAHFNAHV